MGVARQFWNFSKYWFLGVAVLLLVVGPYFAWKAERESYDAAQETINQSADQQKQLTELRKEFDDFKVSRKLVEESKNSEIASLRLRLGQLQSDKQSLQLHLDAQRTETHRPKPLIERYACFSQVQLPGYDTQGVLVEFGTIGEATDGFTGIIQTKGPMADRLKNWWGPPLRTDMPANRGGVRLNSSEGFSNGNTIYRRSVSSPKITKNSSWYVYIVSSDPGSTPLVTDFVFASSWHAKTDQTLLLAATKSIGPCPRQP